MLQEKDGVSDFRTAAHLVAIEKIRRKQNRIKDKKRNIMIDNFSLKPMILVIPVLLALVFIELGFAYLSRRV